MIRAHQCEPTSTSPSEKAPASIRIVDPDYSSICNFPQPAFKVVAKKRALVVRFNSSLNDKFMIQHRSSQQYSVVTETLINRILRIRKEIDATYSDMEALDDHELALEAGVDTLRDQDINGVFQAKQLVAALESRSKHIDQEIQEMRIQMLCLKSKCRQFQGNLDSLVLKNDPSSSKSMPLWLKIKESFWARTPACPLLHKDDDARLTAAKCA